MNILRQFLLWLIDYNEKWAEYEYDNIKEEGIGFVNGILMISILLIELPFSFIGKLNKKFRF